MKKGIKRIDKSLLLIYKQGLEEKILKMRNEIKKIDAELRRRKNG